MRSIPKWHELDLAVGLSHKEFRCKCRRAVCMETLVGDYFLSCWKTLRETVGMPIKINSGFRCDTHNFKVGGKPLSKHKIGNAVDIYWSKILADNYTPDQFERLIYACGFKYCYFRPEDRFWHLDVRDEA